MIRTPPKSSFAFSSAGSLQGSKRAVHAVVECTFVAFATDVQQVTPQQASEAVTEFAADFRGTVSISLETATALVRDVILGAHRAGLSGVVICNAHLEPGNLKALKDGVAQANERGGRAIFPDVTRKPHALRLGDEFKSGACHAGSYETSLVLAADPFLVRSDIAEGLEANPSSLSVAIRDGKKTFQEAGGRAARVLLDGAEGQLLGEEGQGAPTLSWVLDKGAAAACAEGLGLANAVLWMTVEYLKTRKQFNVPIGIFQALQHRAVDMFVQVELLKGTSILANALADSSDARERQRAVSAAKAQLTQNGFDVVAQGTQLHGGIGVTDEHDISLYFKRMRVLNALFGDEDAHVRRFMRLATFEDDAG